MSLFVIKWGPYRERYFTESQGLISQDEVGKGEKENTFYYLCNLVFTSLIDKALSCETLGYTFFIPSRGQRVKTFFMNEIWL